jgi:hypothetical protein
MHVYISGKIHNGYSYWVRFMQQARERNPVYSQIPMAYELTAMLRDRFPKIGLKNGYIGRDDRRFIAFGEAIVDVNSDRVTALYESARAEVDARKGRRKSPSQNTNLIFNVVTSLVHNEMNYVNVRDTGRFRNSLNAKELDVFIENGGVCRHFALAEIALLQRFRMDGYIDGKIRLLYNTIDDSGHAWVHYETPSSLRIIADPTLGRIIRYRKGDEKELAKRHLSDWNYFINFSLLRPLAAINAGALGLEAMLLIRAPNTICESVVAGIVVLVDYVMLKIHRRRKPN